MIRPIVLWPDPVLTETASPLETIDEAVEALAKDMLETMYAAKGRGLAAPQIGVLSRIFVMDCTWKTGAPSPRIVINPTVHDASADLATNDEGCLSIPGLLTPVTRPDKITMRWVDETGLGHEERLTGFEAICAQHEIDHLNGRVTLDHLSDAARAAALEDYAP